MLARRRPPLALLLGGYTAVLAWLTVTWNIGGLLNLVSWMPAYVPLVLLAAQGLAILWAALWSWSAQAWPGLGHDKRSAPPAPELPSPPLQASAGVAHDERSLRPAPGLTGRLLQALAGGLVALAIAGGGLYLGRAHFQPPPETLDDFRQDLFQGHQARRLADALAALPPNATVVADWDQATPLWYGEFVDHINPGVAISYPASTLPAVLTRPHGPVFLSTATFRPQTTTLSAAGPFVEVLDQPRTTLPDGVIPLGGAFGDEIQLAAMTPPAQPEYGVLPITLYWRALRRPNADYHVSVRLMPSPDRVAAQRDEAAPVLGLSPTSTWQPGQVTADYYELDLHPLRDAAYELAVVVYQPLPNDAFRNLTYKGADRALMGTLTLAGSRVTFKPA